MSDPSKYTIGWICALTVEYVAAQVFLDETHEPPEVISAHDNNNYTLGRIGKHNIVVAVLPDGEYGLSSAAAVARDLLHSFPNVRIGLLVGVGGGAPTSQNDIRLGDVVVSSPRNGQGGVLQYDFGKSIQNQEFTLTGYLNKPPAVLLAAVSGLRAEFEQNGTNFDHIIDAALADKTRLRRKYSRPSPLKDRLFHSHVIFDASGSPAKASPEQLVPRLERSEDDDNPAIHYGLIASANNLMKDAVIRDKFASDKKVLCFEMEAAGLMNHFPCLVIRGICDYSDSHKNDDWQGYAAMTAAAYAKALVCKIHRTRLENEKKVTEIDRILESVNQQVNEIRDHIEFSKVNELSIAEGTEYDAHQNQHEPNCHPETRVELLKEILLWAQDSTDRRIYWLSGMAGTGKSTIARTIAKSLDDMKQLGGSFFFKRGEFDRSRASLLFSTIARQLVRHRPAMLPFVVDAMKKTDNICSKSMMEQFRTLILNPLKEIEDKPQEMTTSVLVLDALDECSAEKDIDTFVPLLSTLAKSEKYKIKVFVTSRPEIAVRHAFNHIGELHREIRLHQVAQETIFHDIKVFLRDELAMVKDRWNTSHRDRPSLQLTASWPGDERLEMLVQTAVPLFIFAATACRFIQDHHVSSPDEQLANFLQAAKMSGVNDKLSATYLPALLQFKADRTGQERDRLLGKFRRIVGTIILLEVSLPSNAIAYLLNTDAKEVDRMSNLLSSVLDIPVNPSSPVRLFHLSFRDFLLSPSAGYFKINSKETHRRIAFGCLRLLSKTEPLRYNMCSLHPGDKRSRLDKQTIEVQFPPHVKYSCLHWVHHVEQAGMSLKDDDKVHQFLRSHFLHWLEALSILGETTRAIDMPRKLLKLTKLSSQHNLHDFLVDAMSFVPHHHPIFIDIPLHVYWGALVFSPRKSIIRKRFIESAPISISFQQPHNPCWSPLVRTCRSTHGASLSSVGISSDMSLIAGGFEDGHSEVWEISTGLNIKSIGIASWCWRIFSIMFSRDLASIVRVSGKKLEVHNVSTGETVWAAEREWPKYFVHIDISQDSTMIASAHADTTVAIRDINTGKIIRSMSCSEDNESIHTAGFVSFSLESRSVATSFGRHCWIWSVDTGQCIQKLQSDMNVVCPLLLFENILAMAKPDGKVQILNLETGQQRFICTPGKFAQGQTAISCDAKLVAFSQPPQDPTFISIWSLETGMHFQTFEIALTASALSNNLDSDSSTNMAFCAASTSDIDQTPKYGNVPPGLSLAFSQDGHSLAYIAGHSIHIRSLAMLDQLPVRSEDKIREVSQLENTLDVFAPTSKEKQVLVSTHVDNKTRLWSPLTGELISVLENSQRLEKVVVSPNTRHIFTSDFYGNCHIWTMPGVRDSFVFYPLSIGKWKWLRRKGYMTDVSPTFSADSRLIAIRSHEEFSLWTVSGRRIFQDSCFRKGPLAMSADSNTVIYVDKDQGLDQPYKRIKVLSLETNELAILNSSARSFFALAISPDSLHIASFETIEGSSDYSISIWSRVGRKVFHHKHLSNAAQHSSTMAFSCDSKKLAMATTGGGSVAIWFVSTGQCIYRSQVPFWVHEISFSPEFSFLYTRFGKLKIPHQDNHQPSSSTSGRSVGKDISSKCESLSWSGYGFDKDGCWITWNGANIILLPAELSVGRDRNLGCSLVAVGDSFVSWVTESGMLCMIRFSPETVPPICP